MAKNIDTPFLAELKPSKKLQHLFILVHILALGASLANALPFALKLAIVTFIGVNFKIGFARLRIERRKIKYSEKLGWMVSEGDDYVAVTIARTTVISTFFIFLHFQDKAAMLIPNDALTEDDYRQLVVKLKMTVH
jgi:hypothetical protein